jgi:peptide deformylase
MPRQADTKDEAQLAARREEARRHIRVVGDPVLRERAREVTAFDRDLAKLARRMVRVMHDAPGIGLAAPQVGVLRRLIVYDVSDDPRVVVNPVLSEPSAETEVMEEGCLSVPGVTVPVERPVAVRVQGADLEGRRLDFRAEGLEARVIQHEVDHLDGVLILERTTRSARAAALRQLREQEEGGGPRGPGGGL